MVVQSIEITEAGALAHRYWVVQDSGLEAVDGGVIQEGLVTLYVNTHELATIMCTPLDQEVLALGFLKNEGVITSIEDVRLIKQNRAGTLVDVYLHRAEFSPPRRTLLTTGCGGGITLQYLTESFEPLDSALRTTPQAIYDRMRDLHGAARLYNQVRGVHTSILATPDEMLLSAEDIGRHNTLDKIAGRAMLNRLETHDGLLLTSGRISSEMLTKARLMGVPVVASRTAPTSVAVRLAEAWNICVVGYIRQRRMQVYTHPERLGLPPIGVP